MWRSLAVCSLAPIGVVGLGRVASWLVPAPPVADARDRLAREAGFAILGLLVNQALVLLAPSFVVALGLSAALAALGWARRLEGAPPRAGAARMLALSAFALLLAAKLLSEPLARGDGRSIWFFHAKMLYATGGLARDAGWLEPAYAFSHLDYPLPVSALAAELAFAAGFWNAFLPKYALWLWVVPAFAAALAGSARGLTTVFLCGFLIVGWHAQLWTGYQDGLMAAYAGLACWFIGTWLMHGTHLWLALATLGAAASLKNEGVVFLAVGALALRKKIALDLRAAVLAAIGFAGLGAWFVIRQAWGLHNDLQLGAATLTRIAARLGESDGQIARAILGQGRLLKGLALFGLAWALWRRTGQGAKAGVYFSAGVGAAYTLAMIAIYLGTPYDLTWHLESSVDRTMMTPLACLFAAVGFMLDDLAAPRMS